MIRRQLLAGLGLACGAMHPLGAFAADDDFAAGADRLLAGLRAALGHVKPSAAGLVPPMSARAAAPTPAALPVLSQLDALVAQSPPASRDFMRALRALSPRLRWRQSYRAPQVSEQFLQNYGWIELIGAQGLWHDPTVSIGVLLLGPDTHYPEHYHPAVERYIPLSGEAEWFDQDHGWRRVPPLQMVLHRSMVHHAMQTRGQPMLAFFHWSGPGVEIGAKLV